MNSKWRPTRQWITLIAFLLYAMPLLFIIGFSKASLNISWTYFSLSLLFLSLASMAHLFFLFRYFDHGSSQDQTTAFKNPEEILNQENEEELQRLLEKEEELKEEIAYRNEELLRLAREKELEIQQKNDLQEEFELFKKNSEDRLAEEKILIQEYEETIFSLKALMEERHEENERLQSKIRDMAYEIKTLVDLAEVESELNEIMHSETKLPSVKEMEPGGQFKLSFPDLRQEEDEPAFKAQVKTADEAKRLLKRCIDIAQKITVSHHFTSEKSRFRDLPFDNYSLDLRRLCDSLRSETTGAVLVYSQKENRLLFINNQIRSLLGFGPDKFVQDFEYIVQGGLTEWKGAISKMNSLYEAEASLVMKSKMGQDVLLRCQLGLIPTGVFRNSAIGVLYPAS